MSTIDTHTSEIAEDASQPNTLHPHVADAEILTTPYQDYEPVGFWGSFPLWLRILTGFAVGSAIVFVLFG